MNTAPFEPFISWTTGWTEVLDTGSWRGALPVHEWRPSPCHASCPVGGAIPRWVKLLGEGKYQQAWLALVEENPFPAVTGRVCHHPCESECNRAALDGAVGINALEHFLADRALEEGWSLPGSSVELDQRVAVVGGGPAGLACAYHLRRLGYGVTVFEARAELGGLLRYGIPEYRLPTKVLAGELERLLHTGIEARLSTPVAGAIELADLQEEYDAVFLALGAQRARRLSHLGATGGLPVFDGLEFLRWARGNAGMGAGTARAAKAPGPGDPDSDARLSERLGDRVVVVGGGSAAIDVARTVRRLGKEASVICLEQQREMPAQVEEVAQALEEGVLLFDASMIQSVEQLAGVEHHAGGGLALACCRVTLDLGSDGAGVHPEAVEASGFELCADSILVSVGQEAVLEGFGAVLVTRAGLLTVEADTLQTSRPGIFAGGDVARLDRSVSQALGDGRRAARSIAAFLRLEGAALPPRYAAEESVSPEQVNLHYFPKSPRRERDRVPVGERLAGFGEVAPALAAEEARAEAGRCLSCGSCLECDICQLFCPDLALRKNGDAEGYTILGQFCKGCGLCAAECPRGVVRLVQEQR